jgi:raffinose/stachyose/melibiose transport system permease protein
MKKMVYEIIKHLVLFIYGLFTLVPMIWVLLSAFKNNIQIMTDPLGLPTSFEIDNFVFTWVQGNIGIYFLNSLFVGSIATVLTILFSAATAFALTRMLYPKMNKLFTTILLTGLTVPAGVLLIPLYFVLVDYNIYNTYLALILPYIAFGLSFTVIVIMAFMRSIPDELLEAAVIDGSTLIHMFWKVALPLCVPVLVTTFILAFINNWNEFVMAQFYIDNVKIRTLPVGMLAFRDEYTTNYTGIAVGVLYSVIPVLIVYGILQEKIISGLTAGSLKG